MKRTVELAEAQKLLDLIDRIDEMWRATGGAQQTRMQQLQPVGVSDAPQSNPVRDSATAAAEAGTR